LTVEQRNLLKLESSLNESPAKHSRCGDSIIVIHLGPDQTPEVARILRSQWPTVTALNYAQEREFHVRLRRHSVTGVFLVYASVGISSKNKGRKSIFGDIIQRGRIAKTPDQIKAGIEEIRAELGIPPFGGTSLPFGGTIPPFGGTSLLGVK